MKTGTFKEIQWSDTFREEAYTMVKHSAKLIVTLLASLLLFGCSSGQKFEIETRVTLDGQSAKGAKVLINNVDSGATDENGYYLHTITSAPGTEVKVAVTMDLPGHKIDSWEKDFILKVPPEGKIDRYPFTINLTSTKYITFAVTDNGVPVKGAQIKLQKKKLGKTNDQGELDYTYSSMPGKGFQVEVRKNGYSLWKERVKAIPGQQVAVALNPVSYLTVIALTEEYGLTKKIRDVKVKINNRVKGKTKKNGSYTYVYRGKPGKKITLTMDVPGFDPAEWTTTVVLGGKQTIQRYFYPAELKPIRVGVYGYVSNTPDVDLSEILTRNEEALANNLFSHLSFREVAKSTLLKRIKQSRLNIEQITTKGWQNTRLVRTVDMIILGSVTQDGQGYTIETKVHTSNGKLLLSQISRASTIKDIKKTAKNTVKKIIERFPFEGTVIAIEGDDYTINIGKYGYNIMRGMEFTVMTAKANKSGKITSHKELGTLQVKNVGRTYSTAEIVETKSNQKVKLGDKVIRSFYTEKERKAATDSLILSVKGGLATDVRPLNAVNVYLNDMWVGATDSKGGLKVPVRLKKTYNLVLYRHGYQKLSAKVKAAKNNELKKFTLEVNNAMLKLESAPSGAQVFVDEDKIGSTPLSGKYINFGFHTLKLVAGGDYREWEEVREFNKKVVDLTGRNKITLLRDYLKIGMRAEEKGDMDGAFKAYSDTDRKHPDYAHARHRLGQIYMDVKNDYDAAISEFENVMSLPETKHLIRKQFAVAYTNLGHAYYEKGNSIMRKDRESAARNFATAIQNLKTAKQNTRFFPKDQYDEAVHDTYYYLAISYHKLYLVTRKNSLLARTDQAWREYMDFFPKSLENDGNFTQIRESARKNWAQIKDLL